MSEVIKGDAGRVTFLLKGTYDSETTYDLLDVVRFSGASYVAKKETTGNTPVENNEFWQILVGLDSFANNAIYGNNSINMGRKQDSTVGNKSIAFGVNLDVSGNKSMSIGETNDVSGINSFSGGYNNKVKGSNALSIGNRNKVIGQNSFSGGYNNEALGVNSMAFGNDNVSVDNYTFVNGCGNIALGFGSHAENAQNIAGAKYVFKIKSYDATENKFTFDDTFEGFTESFAALEVGSRLHVANVNYISDADIYTVSSIGIDGKSVIVNEDIPTSSYAVFYATLIKVNLTTSAENYNACHAEGIRCISLNNSAHSEGYLTIAIGNSSHVGGYGSKSKGRYSFAHGRGVIAGCAGQTAVGFWNVDENNPNNYNNPFLVGIGNSDNDRINGFRINRTGAVYGKGEYNSSGADYAEFIKEWHDGNPDNEDRVGYFVTVKDSYLHKANEGDYIVGVTSGNPSIVGNSDEEYYWRWERDEFNRVIYEEVPELIEKIGEDGDIVRDEFGDPVMVETGRIIKRPKQSNDYDISLQQSYVERKDRKEWDYVGMVGVVPVRDDGTCEVGKFCKCSDGGIATLAETREFDTYMVIDRISENIVSVILK